MYVGGSLFLIAVGAILRYAIADMWAEVDLPMIGFILMVVGVIGLVVSLLQMLIWGGRRRRVVEY
jgi:hypothetical protein